MRTGCETCATKLFVRGDGVPVFAGWKNGYQFNIKRSGSYYIGKTINGTLYTLKNWTPTAAIKKGSAWNTLRVKTIGKNLEFYINNIRVYSGIDPKARTIGKVGVGLYSNGSGGVNRVFVNYAKLVTGVAAAAQTANSGTTGVDAGVGKPDPKGGNW